MLNQVLEADRIQSLHALPAPATRRVAAERVFAGSLPGRENTTMSTVQEIEQANRNLGSQDLAALRDWFTAYGAELWDRQLEQDVAAGRLDWLAEETRRDLNAGRCTDL